MQILSVSGEKKLSTFFWKPEASQVTGGAQLCLLLPGLEGEREKMALSGKSPSQQLPWEPALAGQLQYLSWGLWITRHLSPSDIPSWIPSSYLWFSIFVFYCHVTNFHKLRDFKQHKCMTSQFSRSNMESWPNCIPCLRSHGAKIKVTAGAQGPLPNSQLLAEFSCLKL